MADDEAEPGVQDSEASGTKAQMSEGGHALEDAVKFAHKLRGSMFPTQHDATATLGRQRGTLLL